MVLFPPIVSLLMENGGAILVDCLITDHRTAARPAVTTICSVLKIQADQAIPESIKSRVLYCKASTLAKPKRISKSV